MVLTIQWGSGGESRILEYERDELTEAVETARTADDARRMFPVHGSFGALNVGVDQRTLWLYGQGGAYIVGDLIDKSLARPKSMPSGGTVDISSLPPEHQAAIMTLLKASKR
jgi:hypothetical protein